MNFNLKNVKTAKSRNGFSMSADFYINEIKVANFIDKGDGGEPTFHVLDKNLFASFEEKLSELPELFLPAYGFELKIDAGLFIDLLHAALVNKKEFTLLAA